MMTDQKSMEKTLADKEGELSKLAALEKENKSLKKSLGEALKQIEWLKEQFKLTQAKKFASSTETSQFLQFDLFADQEGEEQDVQEESKETISYTHKKKKVGRQLDTSNLPRERQVHDLSDEEKCCGGCGEQMKRMGEDKSEQLEFIPAQLKVIEHVRPKYTCHDCNTIKMAPSNSSAIKKGMAGNSLIAEVVVNKYEWHEPFYRQSQRFLSQGAMLPRNTMVNWALQASECLAPISQALWEQLKSIHVLQADETRVKMLDDNKTGFMWCYHSCDPNNRFVLFAYADSRASQVPEKHLADYKGILQTDGYSGYNSFRASESVINIGCFAHCRRKFVDVVKISGNKTGKAHQAVSDIGKLYEIERNIKELSVEERKAIRQEKAKPILDKFNKWLRDALEKTPPKSKLGQAIGYALNQWDYLYEYINHGEVDIDNNGVENKIRPFALGRKNWLFVGNQRGADAAALYYSLIQTCKLHDISPRAYLKYVLGHTDALRRKEIDAKELLPQFIDKTKLG